MGVVFGEVRRPMPHREAHTHQSTYYFYLVLHDGRNHTPKNIWDSPILRYIARVMKCSSQGPRRGSDELGGLVAVPHTHRA